jgi:DNA-binding MltR family transcriptional regulator
MTEEATSVSNPEMEEFIKFLREFAKESDRAAVILGAAKIDTQLYQILQKALIPCASGRDELLDGDSPLSSFSSRINIIYRLGLIDRQLAWTLHLIRKIRNSFAHELSGVTLIAGPHRDRIRELVAPLKPYIAFKELKEIVQQMEKLEDPSAEFRTVVAIVSLQLNLLFATCETLASEEAFSLIPSGWKKGAEKKEPK